MLGLRENIEELIEVNLGLSTGAQAKCNSCACQIIPSASEIQANERKDRDPQKISAINK